MKRIRPCIATKSSSVPVGRAALGPLWRGGSRIQPGVSSDKAGVEAGEESLSYVMDYIADKAARDSNASFPLAELANSAAGGDLPGGAEASPCPV